MKPCLYMVIPCYNEEAVLPVTAPLFIGQLKALIEEELVSSDSRILFVDDGSRDQTYAIIQSLARAESAVIGLRLSRNFSHQNALYAGMMEARRFCDICITTDCDGQDDPSAMREMVLKYAEGNEVVYGVRRSRKNDGFFKRSSARFFYRVMHWMGAETIPDHADYRLMSKSVLEVLSSFKETNLFLRGMVPLVGFRSTAIYYDRADRLAGKTHYSLHGMCRLALNGITSFSVRPLRAVTGLGFLVTLISLIGVIWSVLCRLLETAVSGWASLVCIICFLGGIQLLSLGVIGEYVGRIYLETKSRPRYVISERTGQSDKPSCSGHALQEENHEK